MANLNELREQRTRLALEMRGLVDGDWDQATSNRFDLMDADLNALDKRIDATEKAERLIAESAAKRGAIVAQAEERSVAPSGEVVLSPAEERQALLHYLRGTTDQAAPEIRAYNAKRAQEARAQSVGTNSAGGYLVRGEFGSQLEVARKLYGAMLNVATIYPTSTGAALLLPTLNDTTVSGSILSENSQISESAMTFAQTSIASYMYTSSLVLLSQQLIQDSEFPLDQYLAGLLGERLGRAQNAHWTTGTGSSQPSGVVTGATSGVTASTGSTTTTTYANLVDLVASVDPVYRQNARWMFRDATTAAIRKLVDGQSRPLWSVNVMDGAPDTLLGYPIQINQDVAALAASSKSILFGDFSKYIIRDVTGVQIVRLDERYADYLQVGFYAFQRTGGALLDAGTNPVKFITQAAS